MFVSSSSQQTIQLGTKIGRALRRGDTVALHGPLGAGKTTLVKGIARSLGIEETITSPSFTLIAEYDGIKDQRPVVLYHVDLYRISHPREIEDLGFEEILGGEGICVIEWAEKAEAYLGGSAIHVEISLHAGAARHLKISGLEDV